MPPRIKSISRLTDRPWLNLYETTFVDKTGAEGRWTFASRRPDVGADGGTPNPDAVVVVPVLATPTGRRLVMIKEYRVPIRGYEYGFPAGLVEAGEPCEVTARRELKEETGLEVTTVTRISPRLFSSPGMTDECAVMVFVECEGTPSTDGTDASEDIEILVLDHAGVCRIANDPALMVSAKAWPVLYLFEMRGFI